MSIDNIISKVYKKSIADELGIKEGDILLSINDQKIEDIIEYKFLICDEYLELKIQRGKQVYVYEIEKDYDEDIGIEFLNPIIDKTRSCKNKCIFCFIDQLPKGMRHTLYFKDDDSRLSFLQGNFITLTNMDENDIDKIIKYKISPLNISVHTTDSELRVKMLNNKNAGKIYDIMKRLAKANIQMNCQIVLCPGINDGKYLEKTIEDLAKLYPNVNSVAIVPVGVTKFREGLENLDTFDKESATKVIEYISCKQNQFLKTINTRFVFLSDEFYVLADKKRPSFDEYEGFVQLENGVGLMTKFEEEVNRYLTFVSVRLKTKRKVTIVTGKSAYNFIKNISEKIMNNIEGLQINVYKIENTYFGESITVSGLVTATDIINNLKDKNLGDMILIPKSMLKQDEDVFLDDYTIDDLEKILNVKIIPCEVEGRTFIRKLLERKE
ncbi:putative radical SAM enzyme, TIGR03279 family [Alkalithermobacter thermoalcaliphilus JW-YL-7 = DSM 7308]|uniref:Radical SAM enzyme, TIGR03279 family n=1 Tax=Alkalithermobacter thermoalcaliphilus JW-YL-7 = DSM 7308 TaxID=1121328 RepID=A0A150FPL9_CLOPD|nr:protein of unknown function DUF512 [[Clostridium] paradoxum JW-YL-7 = DSM 7308]SHK97708.1 putative radical SAM enzyme, TIGR03279 family [[Clostridium] paradoxum JW-YL-7 = DSM 7308]